MTTKKSKIDLMMSTLLAPHIISFLIFNTIYYLPLLYVINFGYKEGGVESFIPNQDDLAFNISTTYIIGILSFIFGSILFNILLNSVFKQLFNFQLPKTIVKLSGKYVLECLIIIIIFLITKVLLIREGVYAEYAFDTGSMSSGLWNFSAFLSETLIVLSIIFLTSNNTESIKIANLNIKGFLVMTFICSINLLHGTRIFANISLICYAFFILINSSKNKKKLLKSVSIIVILVIGAFGIFYGVFILRSNVSDTSELFTFEKIMGPLVYETVFSQISLIRVLSTKAEILSDIRGDFLSDLITFIVPRFLLPIKNDISSSNQWVDFSPLGAISGYACGYLYFGTFFFLFYLLVGFTGAFLSFKASKNGGLYYIIYFYFICDFLYRIMRDGYIIPIKMFFNMIVIVIILHLIKSIRILRPISKNTLGA